MDAALLTSSAPAMVVLMCAMCDLGAPALASEALDACYFDVSAIPYEVLWAALQAHAIAGRSAEARQLLLSWLEAHPVEPELASAHEARVLRLVRLMRTRVMDPEDRLAVSDLAKDVARGLTLQSSRDQMWAEISRAGEAEATDDAPAGGSTQASTGCTSATCGPDGGARPTFGRGACTSSMATNTGAEGTCGRASSWLQETELWLHMAERGALLQAFLQRLRSWWASLAPRDWWWLREAAEEAIKAAPRFSHRRVNGTALAAGLVIAAAALLSSLRKRMRGRLAARRLHGVIEQLGALLGMLLGGNAPGIRAPP